MSILIASELDIADITELFYQIELHYFGDEAPLRDEIGDYVRSNIFHAHSGVQVVLAREDTKPIGIATFSILYPAPGMTGQLFMKDLFTTSAARGKGIGKALMRFLANLAIEKGCNRFDWTAERSNPSALEFYDYIGARRVEEKVYYRFTGEELRSFANGV